MKNISFEKKLNLLLIIILGCVAFAAVITYKKNETRQSSEKDVAQSQNILLKTEQVFTLTQDIIIGSGSFIMMGDTAFLYIMGNASDSINKNFDELNKSLQDHADQGLSLDTLKFLIDKRIEFAFEAVQMRKQNGFDKATQLLISGKSKLYMDRIRKLIKIIQKEEEQTLITRQTAYAESELTLNRSIFCLFASISSLLIILFFIINTNLRARKKAEAKVIKYEPFFYYMQGLGCIANREGYFELLNPQWAKALGYTEKELLEKKILEFIHPDDIEATLKEIEKLKTGADTLNFVNRFRKKDGSYLWFDWNASLDTATVKLYAVAHDITERNKAEELLKVRSKELEDRNYKIIDSINYARRIQTAIINKPLPTTSSFNGSFSLLQPKDILSGDFFWHYHVGDIHINAAVDCTGHGVPGALMSLIAYQFLNQVVIEEKCYEPAEILKKLDSKLGEAINQNSNDEVRDGMDIALCRIDAKEKVITFSGALRPLFYFNGSKLIEIKGSRHGIGGFSDNGEVKIFGHHEITYKEGDCIYLTSDGYQSQFHHKTGKKMMKIRLRSILESAATKNTEEQEQILKHYFMEWKGKEEQVDDLLVVGVKF